MFEARHSLYNWLKDIWIFSTPRYGEPLLKYVSFPLNASKKKKLLIFSFVVVIAVASVSILEHFLLSATEDMFLIDSPKHSSLEIFCGLISIIIGFILFWEYSASGKRNVLFLVLAFFSMGILDLFHAFANYDHNMFVWFHSFSAFYGSAFLFGSLFIGERFHGVDQSAWVRRLYALFGISLIFVFAVASIKFDALVPRVLDIALPYNTPVTDTKGHFSDFIYTLNLLSGMMFLFTGVVFLKGFLRTNDIIYLIFCTSTFLFFESEFLFTFSKLWDPIWWYWHVIKVIIFSGLLVGIAYGFTLTVYTLNQSRSELSNVLEEIENKNIEIRKAYERLKETQIYLKESEKLASIGKMAAGLAHEIRNPIGAITNSMGVIKRYSSLDRDDMELFEIVENEMGRLNKLVGDFLDFSKPSDLKKEETDVHRTIDETLSILRFDPKAMAGITVTKSFAPNVPRIMLDRNRIKQILLNLFINAMQAMPEGGLLTIKTMYRASEDEVEIIVADSGVGMSDEVLTQAFQPFFTTKDKGLGLGLNIVHKTVKEHGGYVLISSRMGEGTQFQLNFPVKAEKESLDRTGESTPPPGHSETGR